MMEWDTVPLMTHAEKVRLILREREVLHRKPFPASPPSSRTNLPGVWYRMSGSC
jgi:hypothetical protein